MQKPILDGVTVLDLTRVLCGPYATMHLGDMGADVIKIEPPVIGDETRTVTPTVGGESIYYMVLNRNKRSMTLNLKAPEGKAAFMELVKTADVIIENYRPGVVEKLGIAYEDVKKVNPRIIYAAASGFGTKGAYSQRAGYDICAQAMSGLISLTGPAEGPMTRVGFYAADHLTGLNLEIGILGALFSRERTGEGQYLEVALADAVVSVLPPSVLPHWADGSVPPRVGNGDPTGAPIGVFEAKDGSFVMSCGNDKLFGLFCRQVLNRPELAEVPEYQSNSGRAAHKDVLEGYVREWAAQHTVDECVNALIAANLPTAPILNIKQIHEHEYFREVGKVFVPVEAGNSGEHIDTVAQPIHFSNYQQELRYRPPMLGEHNYEVYHDQLGLDDATLEEYKKKGII